MQVKLPLQAWPATGAEPGKLVLIGGAPSSCYGLAIAWDGGEAAYLMLDGPNAGETAEFRKFGTMLCSDDVELRVSRKASDWRFGGYAPDVPLSVCYIDERAYFIIRAGGRPFAINAATGSAGALPPNPYYTTAWGIYEIGAKAPFIGQAVV